MDLPLFTICTTQGVWSACLSCREPETEFTLAWNFHKELKVFVLQMKAQNYNEDSMLITVMWLFNHINQTRNTAACGSGDTSNIARVQSLELGRVTQSV
jgi:hypothetical protein